MKKAFAILFIPVFLLLSGCSMWYGENTVTEGNIIYYTSSVQMKCFAYQFNWDGSAENMTINIPDEVDGYKVTALGGYIGRGVPTSFNFNFADREYTTVYFEDIPEEKEITYYHFTVNIGKNVKELNRIYMNDYYYFPADDTYVELSYTVNCSEKNKHFYSKDGKLYNKSNDSLITDFNYFSDLKMRESNRISETGELSSPVYFGSFSNVNIKKSQAVAVIAKPIFRLWQSVFPSGTVVNRSLRGIYFKE